MQRAYVSVRQLDIPMSVSDFSDAELRLFKHFLRMGLDPLSQLILSGPSEEDREAWDFQDDHFLSLARRARRHLTGAMVVEGLEKTTLEVPAKKANTIARRDREEISEAMDGIELLAADLQNHWAIYIRSLSDLRKKIQRL